MKNFDFFTSTRVIFGAGRLDELASVNLPGKKALVVTTSGSSVKKYGYLDRVIELLKKNNTEAVVYAGITPNPTLKQVTEAADLAKANGCDFILGLGGGSPIDASKMIAIMCKNPGNLWDYMPGGTGKGQPVLNGALPIVSVSTTAGTGSEVDPWSVITNEDTTEKIGFGIPDITFPAIAIIDPELTLSVPPTYTAYQGFDTLMHLVECYISAIATPISDLFALKGIELIAKYLGSAVKNGQDIEVRSQVSYANVLGGFVQFLSGCVSQHPMEHALSAYHPDLPHGAGLIMLSEAYFSFFADKIPQRFIDMAKVMGEDVDALPENEKPFAFITALNKLRTACGVADMKMSSFGITESELVGFAKNAWETMPGLFENHDQYVMSLDETIKIYEKSFK